MSTDVPAKVVYTDCSDPDGSGIHITPAEGFKKRLQHVRHFVVLMLRWVFQIEIVLPKQQPQKSDYSQRKTD